MTQAQLGVVQVLCGMRFSSKSTSASLIPPLTFVLYFTQCRDIGQDNCCWFLVEFKKNVPDSTPIILAICAPHGSIFSAKELEVTEVFTHWTTMMGRTLAFVTALVLIARPAHAQTDAEFDAVYKHGEAPSSSRAAIQPAGVAPSSASPSGSRSIRSRGRRRG